MIVSMIAALAENRLIGSGSGGIPWNLPRDRAHFRHHTAGAWLLLGRKTYEEMHGWFTNQIPLILTRDPDLRPRHPAHRFVPSPAAAIDLARANGAAELVICGGASVYTDSIHLADRLIITRILTEFAPADPVFFPDYGNPNDWKREYAESWPCDKENPFPTRLEIYGRPEHG